MKQFLVLCAVLPLMLVIILQMSLDQISNYKINAVNQAVYAAKERAQQQGYFSDEIQEDLSDQLGKLGFDSASVETEFDDYDCPQNLGTLLNYMVKVRIDNAMVEFMAGGTSYDYVIDSCTVSQYILTSEE